MIFSLSPFIVGSTGCRCSKGEKRDGAKTFHHSTKGTWREKLKEFPFYTIVHLLASARYHRVGTNPLSCFSN